jgi:hypothetical protein
MPLISALQSPGRAPPSDLGQSIEETVRNAIEEALRGAQDPGLTRSEAAQLARDRAQAAIDRLQAQMDARRIAADSRTVQPPPFNVDDFLTPRVLDLAFAFFFTIAVIAIGVPLARAFGRRITRSPSAAAPDVSPRLDRIEQAIEAVAIEVERISEGQRFTTRLMSELRALPGSNPLDAQPVPARQPEPVIEPRRA